MTPEFENPPGQILPDSRLPSPWVSVAVGFASISMVQSWLGPALGLLTVYLGGNYVRNEKRNRVPAYIGLILGVSGLAMGMRNLPQFAGGQYANTFQDYIGVSAGDFTLPDITGRNHSLSDYTGKVALINFWATWCPPCRDEIPELVRFRNRHQSQGFEILAISGEEPETQQKFAESNRMEYPLLVDNGRAVLPRPFSFVSGIPSSFLIDREGVIRVAVTGPLTGKDLAAMAAPWLDQSSLSEPATNKQEPVSYPSGRKEGQ